MRFLAIALLGLSCFGAVSAEAGEITGQRLLMLCKDAKSAGCTAYVMGFADAESGISPHRFCVPHKVTETALRETLTAYLDTHASDLARPRAELTLTAFTRAFPCGK
jgi:hypothetical protein